MPRWALQERRRGLPVPLSFSLSHLSRLYRKRPPHPLPAIDGSSTFDSIFFAFLAMRTTIMPAPALGKRTQRTRNSTARAVYFMKALSSGVICVGMASFVANNSDPP